MENVPVARLLLFGLFSVLMVERMMDWELSLVTGLSVKNLYIYSILGVLFLGTLLRGRILLSTAPHVVTTAFYLLLGYAALSWYFAPELNLWNLPYDRVEGFIALKRLMDQFMLFLLFLILVRGRDQAMSLSRKLLALIAISNVITLIDVYDIIDLGIIHEREDGRISGTMGESNQFGAFLVLFLPGIVAMPFLSRGLVRVLWFLGALASIAALLLTVSRGALSAVVVGALCAAVFLYRYIPHGQLTRGALVGAAASVIAVAAVMVQYGELLYSRLFEKTLNEGINTASSGRSDIWLDALSTMAEHPTSFLVGTGWNMYHNMQELGLYVYNTHNTYLGYFYDLGLIGLTLFLVLVASVLLAARRGIASMARQERTLLIMFVIGFISLLWAVFFVDLFKPWLLIWAYSGLMMRIAVGTAEAPEIETEATAQRGPATSGALASQGR